MVTRAGKVGILMVIVSTSEKTILGFHWEKADSERERERERLDWIGLDWIGLDWIGNVSWRKNQKITNTAGLRIEFASGDGDEPK